MRVYFIHESGQGVVFCLIFFLLDISRVPNVVVEILEVFFCSSCNDEFLNNSSFLLLLNEI